jgi:hypothetical protein
VQGEPGCKPHHGILKRKNNVLREEMLKYTTLWMQKLEQEALFTFMESKTDQ